MSYYYTAINYVNNFGPFSASDLVKKTEQWE